MQMNTLAGGTLSVSAYSLGTMTYGNQTPEDDAHRQIAMSLEHGINLVDTAEMYPVNPVRAETAGRTEEIIGNWLAANGRRDEMVLATKMVGPSPVIRPEGITAETIRPALEASLKRLKTDYVDIYQLHWPQRGSYHFRQNWKFDPSSQDRAENEAHMRMVLGIMSELVAEGKIRHFALSNESTWGTAEWLRLAREMGAPEVVSIQNEYSMLCRLADLDLAELCVNEGVGILAYSPLATGLLTGKYHGGETVPDNSRLALNSNLGGRVGPRLWPAVDAYLKIAEKHGLDPVHMSLAFAVQKPFMGSTIFGATTTEQLQRILDGTEVRLSPEIMKEIDKAHRAHPMPY